MKKLTKKLFALLLAAAMLCTMGVTAFAAEAPSKADLSINNPTTGSTYKAYKVMDAKVSYSSKDKADAVYTYTVTNDFNGFFNNNPDGYSLNSDNEILKNGKVIGTDGRWKNTNATEAAALASALEDYAVKHSITGINLPATGIGIGYYVVAETETTESGVVASKPMLVDLRDNTQVTQKDSKVKLDKKIIENGDEVKENTANIGDTIKYKVNTAIPSYEANVDRDKLSYVLTDKFTNLEYGKNAKVTIVNGSEDGTSDVTLVAGTDYIIKETGSSFEISLNTDTILKYQGKEVKLEYSAVLTKDAQVGTANPNDIKLVYSNNPNKTDSKGTLEDKVKTYTYGFNIQKVDKNNENKDMAGASFEVKDSEGKTIGSFTYGADGTIESTNGGVVITKDGNIATLKGLKEGEYTITETQAPQGYSILAEPVKVRITDERNADGELTGKGILEITKGENVSEIVEITNGPDNTITMSVKIKNSKGISLPETGSRTAMYCLIAGVMMIILGGAYVGYDRIYRRRRQN